MGDDAGWRAAPWVSGEARPESGVRRDAARLRVLTEFARVVSAARSYDDVLRLVAIEARRALDASSISISVFERESGVLRTLVNEGELGPGFVPRPSDEVYVLADFPSTARMLAENVGFVHSTEAYGDDVDPAMVQLLKSIDKGSCIGVPLLLEGRMWGELFATRRAEEQAFTTADLDFALAVAAQAAAGIAQAEHIARVERLAYSDALTGLGNRRTLDDRLDAAMERYVADGTDVGVVVADVNGLKAINDEYGHARGDTALMSLAAVLSNISASVEGCTVARLGGDEFALVMVGMSPDQVVSVAERLCDEAQRVLPDGVACGVACTGDAPAHLTEPGQLLRLADAAQYRAKRSGLRAPVVAGRHLSPQAVAAARLDSDRRSFRSRGVDTARLLDLGVAALEAVGPQSAGDRLATIGQSLGQAVDVASWWLNVIPPGSDRIFTRDGALYRRPDGYQDAFQRFYDDPAGYACAEFPATDDASRGAGPVVADTHTGEGDPAELSLLSIEGCYALVMSGGVDARGSRWALEFHIDELSVPIPAYASVLRLLTALAVVGADPSADPSAGTG